MVTGTMNRRILRAGLSVMAAMLLSAPAYAQDTGEGVVVHVIEPVFDWSYPGVVVDEPDPHDGGPDIVIDDVGFIHGDSGPGDDASGDEDWADVDLGGAVTGSMTASVSPPHPPQPRLL